MKNVFLVLTMLVISGATFAQQGPPPPPKQPMEQGPRGGRFQRGGREHGPDREKLEMFKVDFFTKKLALTKAEAELFWPVYEAHRKAAKEIMDNKSNDEIQVQEAMLAARKKFKADLKPILKTEDRVNDALKIDREFLQEIRHEMMRRKGFQS